MIQLKPDDAYYQSAGGPNPHWSFRRASERRAK